MSRLLERLDALDARFHLGEAPEARWLDRGGPGSWEALRIRRPVAAVVLPFVTLLAVISLVGAFTLQLVGLAFVLGIAGYRRNVELGRRYAAWTGLGAPS